MLFFQPELQPPLEEHTIEGQNVIVTGGNSGIGLSIACELLRRGASNVILAVRNIENGKDAKSHLLSDPQIRKSNPTGTVDVMQIDLENYASVISFADEVTRVLPSLHLLVLNAGVGKAKFERSTSDHERTLQVNHLSNVLLLLSLLPLLRKTAEQTTASGGPCYTRVTWTGSRAHEYTSLASKLDETVLGHFDAAVNFALFRTYADSKLLAALFVYELGQRLSVEEGKVIVNMFCPGLVNTKITDTLPWYLRIPLDIAKSLIGRSAEHAGWVAVNAAVVVGKESHGRFLGDMEFFEKTDFIISKEGKAMQEKVWEETIQEMLQFPNIHQYMKSIHAQSSEVSG